MSISIVPGFHRERKQLVRLLDRAAELSRNLRVCIDGAPVELDLESVARALQELGAYQAEKR